MPHYQLLKFLKDALCSLSPKHSNSSSYLGRNLFLGHSLIACLLVFVTITAGFGQGKNFQVNKTLPTWIVNIAAKNKKPSAKDVTDGYFLALYENQNHVELQEDYTHIIREIVSDAGVQNGSQISVTYDPGFQKLTFHKIVIWRDGKVSDRLKANGFKLLQTEKELSRFIYSGTYDAFMLLEDVRKGDRIEFAYTIKGINPIFGKKYATTYYFEGGSSIGHIYSNVIFNKDRKLNFRNFNSKDDPKVGEKDGLKMYEWESTLTKTHRSTDYEPGWYNPLKRTQLTEYNSWSEVVDWALAVNNYPNLKTPLVDKKVKELKAKAGADLKKYIELATRFVQDEIRYMGIEIGAYSHRPNSPEKIMIQRYGDCKDKSLLLVSMLKANGINAYMTYADTYTTIKTNQYLPSPFVFNHVIVMVDYNNYKTWIDPTISYQRGEFDDFYAPNYGNVLVIKKGTNALEKIESQPVGKLISNLTFNLSDTVPDNRTSLKIVSVYTDNYADDIRGQIADYGTDGMEKTFLEYITKLYPDIDTKESIKIEDDVKSNTIEITESYEITNIWSENTELKDKAAYFYGDLISGELRKIASNKRLTPIVLNHSVNIEQNIFVILPYQVDDDDDSFKVENDKYYFDLYRNQRDKEVRFSFTYRNYTDHIDKDKVKEYVKDIKKIDDYLSFYINRGTSGSIASSGINFYMLGLYLLIIAATSFLVFKLYTKKEQFDIEKISDAIPLGGWLILLAIRVVIVPIVMLVQPFSLNMMSNKLWAHMKNFASAELTLQVLFALELVMFAALLVYSVYCAILFFQRRKCFAAQYIVLCIAHIIFLVYDQAIAAYMNSLLGNTVIVGKDIVSLFFSICYGLIWILYLLKSDRVQQTFVFTYPKHEWQIALTQYYNTIFAKQEIKESNAATAEHDDSLLDPHSSGEISVPDQQNIVNAAEEKNNPNENI